MAHVVAAERATQSTKTVREFTLRSQKQPRILQAACGQDDVAWADGDLIAAQISDTNAANPAVLGMVQPDNCRLQPEIDCAAVAQASCIVCADARTSAPPFNTSE